MRIIYAYLPYAHHAVIRQIPGLLFYFRDLTSHSRRKWSWRRKQIISLVVNSDEVCKIIHEKVLCKTLVMLISHNSLYDCCFGGRNQKIISRIEDGWQRGSRSSSCRDTPVSLTPVTYRTGVTCRKNTEWRLQKKDWCNLSGFQEASRAKNIRAEVSFTNKL